MTPSAENAAQNPFGAIARAPAKAAGQHRAESPTRPRTMWPSPRRGILPRTMKRTISPLSNLALAGASLLALLSACRTTASPEPVSPGALVSAAELGPLLARLGDDAVVLDVRERSAYDAGHLTGAVWLSLADWEALSLANDTGLSHEAAWRERIGSLGIDGDDFVFVYDGGKLTQAARIWFVLQHFGAASASVVDGGWPALVRGLESQTAPGATLAITTAPSTRPAVRFEPNASASIGLVERGALRLAIERGDVQVLDARTTEEYRGLDLRSNSRGGHLPGAISLPHTRLIDEQGCLKSIDELQRLLAGAGFERGRPVITHCDGGGRAALAALAAQRAGFGPVLNYYLSFGDWSKDSTCPVVND